jgi:hypothetical protein
LQQNSSALGLIFAGAFSIQRACHSRFTEKPKAGGSAYVIGDAGLLNALYSVAIR